MTFSAPFLAPASFDGQEMARHVDQGRFHGQEQGKGDNRGRILRDGTMEAAFSPRTRI
jgi:hypothetical protein